MFMYYHGWHSSGKLLIFDIEVDSRVLLVNVLMENSKGFTMPELLVILAIIGIMSVIAGPQLLFANKPLQNGTNQLVGILKQTRSRAMVTTSIYRVKPTSATQLEVKTAQARACAGSTQLTQIANTNDTMLHVASVNSFGVGDQVIVGTSPNSNSVIATDPGTNIITLGQPLGSTQPINADVKLSVNWTSEPSFSNEDLTLPKEIQMNPTNWILCFDSRGIANQYNNSGIVNGDLTVTLTDTSGKQSNVNVLQGGVVSASF